MSGEYERAAALHARAVEFYNTGRPARSLKLLRGAQRTLARADDVSAVVRDALEARILISIALDECEMHSIEEGLETLRRAEALTHSMADPAVLVLLHTQRGLIHLRRGDFGEARASFDAAVGLIDHAQPRDQANLLLNRGTVGLLEGELRHARADLERSVDLAVAANLRTEQFKALHNLAYLEYLAGDLPRALRLMDAAGAIDASVSRGVWLMDRARVLVDAGLAHDADVALAGAIDILRRDRMRHDLGEALLERSRCALTLGDAATARRFARGARDVFARQGKDKWRRSSELILLQADVAAGHRVARLIPIARRLRAELDGDGVRLRARAAALIEAEACLAAGRVDAASRALDEIGAARSDDPITGRMHDHYVHARVQAAAGKATEATRRIRRALDELARYQASFGSIDLRTASAIHGRRLAELDISVALESGRPAAVFAAAERARAVSSRLPPIRPPADSVAAELLAELRQTVDGLRAAEQDRVVIESLLRKRRDLERQIRARSWTLSGTGSVARPASLENVRAALGGRGRTMVIYVQGGSRLSAIVVGARVRLTEIGPAEPVIEQIRRVRADLDVLAHPRLAGEIRSAVRASLQRSLAALDATLLLPLEVDGPLALVSTGMLGQLPWASLPSLRRRPLAVAPSATKWLTSIDTDRTEPFRVSALAGPELDRGPAEVRTIGSVWPGADVKSGEEATAAAFGRAMASSTVLHVAAHGVHQPDNPLFSSVRMTDGPVFAHELDQSKHAPEHVVLSACEVGLATIRPGDEALGLASVLLSLGTRSVIAGVATVGDDVAARTMSAYHAELAAGSDSSIALANALSDVDSDVTPPFVNFGASWSANLEAAR